LTFTEAASIPLVGLTALQALQLADQTLQGGVKGKTVLVPGGLSGTGSLAIQLAKNVFGAEKVITTLSTGKIEKAKELLGAETFTAVDYTKENVVASVGSDTVDYLFDTMGTTVSYLATVKKGGLIISISTIPSGSLIKKSMSADIPYYIECIMNFVDWGLRWWTGRKGVNYSYIFMTPSAKDLDSLSTWIEEGKITPIVGRTAKFDDLEGVRTGCQQIFDGKGGIGKFVIEMA
jgi:NADPH:quinone reductase-like Zn-dependent oxidoreductase